MATQPAEAAVSKTVESLETPYHLCKLRLHPVSRAGSLIWPSVNIIDLTTLPRMHDS